MARDGLLIGELAARTGLSRTGILPAARRTASGYRVYGQDALALLAFVAQARRLGFHLDEIKSIVTVKRSGRTPCLHVANLVQAKLDSIEQTLSDLAEVRRQLQALLVASKSRPQRAAAVCPCIEHLTVVKGGGEHDGTLQGDAVPRRVRPVPRR